MDIWFILVCIDQVESIRLLKEIRILIRAICMAMREWKSRQSSPTAYERQRRNQNSPFNSFRSNELMSLTQLLIAHANELRPLVWVDVCEDLFVRR